MSEDQSSIPSTPRFIRPDAEPGETPKKLPRFIIPDDEAKPRTPRFSRPAPEEARAQVEASVTAAQFELSEGAAEVEAPPVVEVPAVETHEPEAPEAAPAASVEPDTTEIEAITAEPEATEEPVAADARARVALPARADPVVGAHAPPGRHGAGHAAARALLGARRAADAAAPSRSGIPRARARARSPMWPPAATEPAARWRPRSPRSARA